MIGSPALQPSSTTGPIDHDVHGTRRVGHASRCMLLHRSHLGGWISFTVHSLLLHDLSPLQILRTRLSTAFFKTNSYGATCAD